MDTSETYIKMCEKAEKIQKRKLVDGDFYYWTLTNKVHISYVEQYSDYVVRHPEHWDYLRGRKIIWLPRQDQLQEMVLELPRYQSDACILDLIKDFEEFVSPYWDYTRQFNSMEQLWLAFVMAELHSKYWDGTQWMVKGEK